MPLVITNAIISFYCACSICCSDKPLSQRKCANGASPREGLSVATGRREIPLNSTMIWTNGITYRIEDRMSRKYDKTNIYHFDIFIGNHQQAKQLGRLHNQTIIIK